MNGKNCIPKTYMNHPNQWKMRVMLQEIFADPDPVYITKEIVNFLQKNPIPIDDFPLLEGNYSRSILFRSPNGFEAMVARWSRGAISSIHGHPDFMLYYVLEGRLEIDNYKRHGGQIKITNSEFLSKSQFLSSSGQDGTFDNLIHQVQAIEETLSLHISSDDATKGEVYNQAGVTL